MRLRNELTLFFGSLILLLGVSVGYVSYHQTYAILEQQEREKLGLDLYRQWAGQTLDVLEVKAEAVKFRLLQEARNLTGFLSEQREWGAPRQQTLAKLGRLSQALLEGGDYQAFLDEDDDEEAWLEAAGIFLSLPDAAKGSYDLALICDDEANVLCEFYASGEGTGVLSLADQPLIVGLLMGELQDYARGYMRYLDGHTYMVAAIPVGVNHQFAPASVILIGKKIDELVVAEASKSALGADTVIVTRDEAFASNQSAQRLAGLLPANTLASPIQTGAPIQLGGREYLYTTYPLQQPPVGQREAMLVYLKSVDEIRETISRQINLVFSVTVGVIVLTLILVAWLARRLTNPIALLTEAMEKVGDGLLESLPSRAISGSIEVRRAAESFNEMVIGLRQKRQYEQFVPVATREAVESSKGEQQALGGSRVVKTIMFSDLRGFTSMSEKLSPDQVLDVLNDYLQRMTGVIRDHTGDINEYIGDAILAVFEDPAGAIVAARHMNEELEELRLTTTDETVRSLRQGIGIHTGEFIEGNIGQAGDRMKLAVIGDTVNLAARIQDRSRDGRFTCILVSQATYELTKDQFEWAEFGLEKFKGKEQPELVWELKV